MKLSYSKPTVFRIKLNYQQAVLAACSSTTTALTAGTNNYCRSATSRCRRGRSANYDSGSTS
jgi:hypothetical protein